MCIRDRLCEEWGVTSIRMLREMTKNDVDELPKYLNDRLKTAGKRRLKKMIESHQEGASQAACESRPAGARGGAESTPSSSVVPRHSGLITLLLHLHRGILLHEKAGQEGT